MKKLFCLFFTILSVSLLAFALNACGNETAAPAAETSVQETAAVPAASSPVPTPTPLLDLSFPDGNVYRSDTATIHLTDVSHADVPALLDLLPQMPGLLYVDLGSDTVTVSSADGTETEVARDLTWDDIRAIQEACPNASVRYAFSLWGRSFTTLDTKMDLNHITMDDDGAAVKEVLPCMTNCTYLDMDFCGVDSEHMAEIRDAYPNMEVVWRIWFGTDCSVRTDVERILASNLNHALNDANTTDLKYCTKLRYLDIGHNKGLTNFEFLREMPDMEVMVISMCGFHDFSVLENCTKLEYFEFCSYQQGYDVGPLGKLTSLEHVNICALGTITGWEELKNLTNLKRLWLGCFTYLPDGAVEELQEALPDTIINTTETTGCLGSWRAEPDGSVSPRYTLLREQFEYDNYQNVCSSYFNDPKYYG